MSERIDSPTILQRRCLCNLNGGLPYALQQTNTRCTDCCVHAPSCSSGRLSAKRRLNPETATTVRPVSLRRLLTCRISREVNMDYLQISLTSKCNRKCVHCPMSQWRDFLRPLVEAAVTALAVYAALNYDLYIQSQL